MADSPFVLVRMFPVVDVQNDESGSLDGRNVRNKQSQPVGSWYFPIELA
ncbi:MAG: hypothetical protein MI923_16535 [Phycisphaerales bacterium]|nr:hypothetical protein [Phycisphaerales bacterium]